ncbi:MAG: hypothetical protein ACKORK_11515, partial [Gemmatimonadota bacterium]
MRSAEGDRNFAASNTESDRVRSGCAAQGRGTGSQRPRRDRAGRISLVRRVWHAWGLTIVTT